MTWRFDQGRLQYLQVDEIRNIAQALVTLDGTRRPTKGEADTVRKVLESKSTKPFLPNHPDYPVWRNYGRVFETLLLATVKNEHILISNICRQMAQDPSLDSDDYLSYFIKHFYYPSPVFDGYDPLAPQIFPGIALIKFLISEFRKNNKPYITINEIGDYLIGNSVTGLEGVSYYRGLNNTGASVELDLRQVREFVIFISQLSFLKWADPRLYLDVTNIEELNQIELSLQPEVLPRNKNRADEILAIGSGPISEEFGKITMLATSHLEEEFSEGKKVRVTHLRSERSSRLRDIYLQKAPYPAVCQMCEVDTSNKYPWASHIIELHHLLPLSSPVRVEGDGTAISDLVGLCPSCHRAIHRYYSIWLKKNLTGDFKNKDEAVSVYEEAKSIVQSQNSRNA